MDVGAGDVEVQRLGFADGGRERFSSGEVDVGDPDECAGASEFLHGGFADAAGAAGDEGDAFVETKCAGHLSSSNTRFNNFLLGVHQYSVNRLHQFVRVRGDFQVVFREM